jgi:hypothetical protein
MIGNFQKLTVLLQPNIKEKIVVPPLPRQRLTGDSRFPFLRTCDKPLQYPWLGCIREIQVSSKNFYPHWPGMRPLLIESVETKWGTWISTFSISSEVSFLSVLVWYWRRFNKSQESYPHVVVTRPAQSCGSGDHTRSWDSYPYPEVGKGLCLPWVLMAAEWGN